VAAAIRTPTAVDGPAAAHPGRAAAVELDVTDSAGIPAAVDEVLRRYGGIDVLVNSAGRALVGGCVATAPRAGGWDRRALAWPTAAGRASANTAPNTSVNCPGLL
jgi:NAD(P)-dependent dehydrogenase (short-subunit alcohol dehydrogenase family)